MNQSPNLPVPSGVVKTEKEFSDALTMDLSDEDIQRCLAIIIPIKKKWEARFRLKSFNNVEEALTLVGQFADEITHTLAEKADVLATVDTSPLLDGQPIIIDYQGVLRGHELAKYGLDHEKKTAGVQKAKELNEDYLGQKNK